MPHFRRPSIYDIQGIAFGIVMVSLGVVFLKSSGLVTGQTAGLSVLLSYVLNFDFGLIFFAINLPFYLLSYRRKGWEFTIKTLIAVAGISACVPFIGSMMAISVSEPALAALLAGCSAGVGLIALFRHNASAGGLGILALIVQERTGFRAGWFQLGFDALVFVAALFVIEPLLVIYSFLGAAVMNALVAYNFRTASAASGD